MFKSIQFKIVAIFVILILTVTVVMGAFLTTNIVRFYNNDFSLMMEQVFTDSFVSEMTKIVLHENGPENLDNVVKSYIGQLGIDTYRFYCIMNADDASVIYTSDYELSRNLDMSDNIIAAMSGARGNSVNTERAYMDYAVSVGEGNERYIVYIRDTKDELNGITRNIIYVVIQSLLVALVITILLAYLLSRTITSPIITLTKRAERIAGGNFENMPVSDSNDEIGRLSNTFRYMSSALSSTIDEVNTEKNKVETILQNMTDGILAFNFSGELIHINPEAQKLLGASYIGGVTFDELFKELDIDVKIGDLLYIEHDKPIEQISSLGSRFIRFSFATITKDEKNDGVLVVLHDITNQEKLELSRREFVANVSHELRTPLTTVKSYAETLMDTSFDDVSVRNRFLGIIAQEADRMTRIVRDLLTLSRLDEKRSDPVPPEIIDVQAFVSDIVDRMSISAKQKNQSISYKRMNPVGEFVTNRDKLEQVIVNIISNAIKYTPDGGKIDVYTGKIYSDIYIKVTDSGIGIPKENLPRIFERFYRVDKARSRDTGGTGLGLAISKQIIEEMGGRISIASEVNKGTEVTVTVPT
ncbi:MAG: HAMP domain-containing protein [Eubacteriales bacterium]|nr:HAMP domain-containing protein [Eubacteriales bacterium]